MMSFRSSAFWRGVAGAGVLILGVLSNLGSNFISAGDPQVGSCVAGTERLELVGDGQTGAAGAPLGKTLRVQYTCNGYQGSRPYVLGFLPITWTVAAGRINGATSITTRTDPDGLTQANWSLGSTLGTQTLTVTGPNDLTAKFTATSVAPTPGGNCSTGLGTNFDAARNVLGDETWTLAGSPYRGQTVDVTKGTLSIEPGVMVCLRALQVHDGGRLVALGTAAQEIRFTVADLTRNITSLQLGLKNEFLSPAAPSVLGFVSADNLHTLATQDHAVLIHDSKFTFSAAARALVPCPKVALRIGSSGASMQTSSVLRTVIDGYGDTLAGCEAAVVLDAFAPLTAGPVAFEARVVNSAGDAVQVKNTRGDPAWALRNCDISKSGRHGVLVDIDTGTPGAVIAGCSITSNAGNGVENRRSNAFNLNARGNWWGDAAGPAGPAGDGISAGVDASSPLAAAPALGY